MGLAATIANNTEQLVRLRDVNAWRGTGRGCVWAHPLDYSATDTYITDTHRAVINALTAGGAVAVSTPAMGGPEVWGNDASQTKFGDARSDINAALGAKIDRLIVCAVSMGALTALNWVRANPGLVACVCLFHPCVALQAQHDGTGGATAAYAGEIEAAYGGLAGFNAAAVGTVTTHSLGPVAHTDWSKIAPADVAAFVGPYL
jgi:pimeloyl-ACP methyl ester carboxylesterase